MKLRQLILFAKDMPRMHAFYRDVIGLTPVDEIEPLEWVQFDCEGTFFALHAMSAEAAARVTIDDPPRVRTDTPMKFAFHADDVDATARQLRERGAAMRDVRRFGTVVLCDGVDPEGNLFQLSNR